MLGYSIRDVFRGTGYHTFMYIIHTLHLHTRELRGYVNVADVTG